MKREEFFEALSDIDEGMVENAKPYEEPVAPVTVTPKRSYLKPVCTAAACVALAAAVTAIAVSVTRRPSSVLPPNTPASQEQAYKTSITVVNKSRYPASVIYPYTGDYSNLEIKYIGDEMPNYPEESHYKLYEELAKDSSLVVMGTFIDDTCQVTDDHDVPDFVHETLMSYYPKYMSFNTLKVEKVLKNDDGKVWQGDEIVIAQPYVYANGAMYSFSQLTPMIKGDSWVYFLRQYSSDHPKESYGTGAYYPVNDYEGRYPVPDNENPPFQYRENTRGVVAPADFNEGVYSELKEKLENAEQSECPPYELEHEYELEYEKVIGLAEALGYVNSYPTGINVEFDMEEFEGITFGWQNGELYSRTNNSEEKKTMVGGPGCYVNLDSTYLCDLNGDGKREICTRISFGSGIVHDFLWIRDHANDKFYVLSKRGETDYTLEKKDGELYLVSRNFPSYYNEDDGVKSELLTLDMLTEIDPEQEAQASEETEQPPANVFKVMDMEDGYSDYLTDTALTFDMEEFPGVMFERDPGGASGDTLYAKTGEGETGIHKLFEASEGGLSRIVSIYLCDLNGDGNREICINAAGYSGVKYICVYKYAESQILMLNNNVNDTTEGKEFEYILGVTDDTLYYSKNALIYEGDVQINGGCVLNEPLTMDVLFNRTFLPDKY